MLDMGASFAHTCPRSLNGMKKILEYPDIKLLVEFFPERLEKTGDSPSKLIEFLLDKNFIIIDLKTNKMIEYEDIIKISREYDIPPNHYTNLYCRKK